MKQRGGLLTAADLAAHRSDWIDPISTTYRGYEVLELPPNTQGIVALEMLNILEGFDLKSLGHNSAAYLHTLVEAKRIAFADRAAWLADGAAVPPAVLETLLSKEYAAARRKDIDPNKAAADYRAFEPAGTAPRRRAPRREGRHHLSHRRRPRRQRRVADPVDLRDRSARGSSPAIPASRSTTAAACSR